LAERERAVKIMRRSLERKNSLEEASMSQFLRKARKKILQRKKFQKKFVNFVLDKNFLFGKLF